MLGCSFWWIRNLVGCMICLGCTFGWVVHLVCLGWNGDLVELDCELLFPMSCWIFGWIGY